ncbi:MAG: aminomethyltransferase family protein [Planctomycetes bacterium]|nr:aminomethyltransferase family protein [Planctomycetota bacterium]
MPANPLAAVHAELGAFLVERAGTPIPARFSDPTSEHRAVRNAIGVFDLMSAGKVFVRGADRARYLNSLLAADIGALAPGRGTYSLLLTRDGRIASDLRVACLDDRFVLLTPPLTRGKVLRTLDRHLVSTDASIDDATETWTLLSVQGPAAEYVVPTVLAVLLPQLPPWGAVELRSPRYGPVVLIRSPRTGENGFDILVPVGAAPALFRRLVEEAKSADGLPCGLDALESLRVETGRPAYGTEIDETTLPVELPETSHGIALGKGCFLGREEAARSLAAAAPMRRLIGVAFGTAYPPVRGDKLKAGTRVVGKLTSTCFSPLLERSIGLALVDADVARPGRDFETTDGDRATITPTPFVPVKLT